MDLRRVKAGDGIPFKTEQAALDAIAPFATKFFWFKERGYEPHIYQLAFHMNRHEDKLRRFRCLVAGRRGGKTLAGAWEVVFYAANPREFHYDAHGRENDDSPLHIWVLTPDYRSSGRAALLNLRKVLKESGLVEGIDYKENRGDLYIEFDNGTLIEFKTAERPDKLVGAGLDILWIDEAALIADDEAWNIARPALSDRIGIVIFTTTPRGKNWFYRMFWIERATDPDVASVEYRSLDNPYFASKEWLDAKRTYHPLMFKQEFMASFDSMAGKELAGDWLHYFTYDSKSDDREIVPIPRAPNAPEEYDLKVYIGVDPAVSLADDADRFAMAAVGVTQDNSQVFLLDIYAGRIPFHEQLDMISTWHIKHRPIMIGIESVAYQRVLMEQALRLEGLPGVIPIFAQGKKFERILSMAPLFKIGKVRIHTTQRDFIEEWLDYDSEKRNPNDDCLDAVEIALRTAGALLPRRPQVGDFTDRPPTSLQERADQVLDFLTDDEEDKFDPDGILE